MPNIIVNRRCLSCRIITASAAPGTNNSRDYSGSTQYCSKATPTGVLTNQAWTIGAWVNSDSYGADGRGIIKMGPLGSLTRGVYFYLTAGGNLRIRTSAGGFGTGATSLSTGTWYRVGARKDGTGVSHMRTFLNGAQDSDDNLDPPTEITTGDVYSVGDQSSDIGPGYYDGKGAWAFYLSGVALSAAAIDGYLQNPQSLVTDYGPAGGVTANALKILWPMQCNGGSTETDKSGVGNDGTYTGATFSSGTGPSPSTGWNPC